jgi:hypothetical protein
VVINLTSQQKACQETAGSSAKELLRDMKQRALASAAPSHRKTLLPWRVGRCSSEGVGCSQDSFGRAPPRLQRQSCAGPAAPCRLRRVIVRNDKPIKELPPPRMHLAHNDFTPYTQHWTSRDWVPAPIRVERRPDLILRARKNIDFRPSRWHILP